MTERDFMKLAVQNARLSKNEDKSGRYPKVGAVVVKDGQVIATGFRGEKPKSHAEYVALEINGKDKVMAGSTVYTTLEPCTKRGRGKIPCAERLVSRQVERVVIGMLDPNKEIRGKGEWHLQEHGIKIGRFDPDFIREIRELNRGFIDYQSDPGISISGPINNTNVKEGFVTIRGTYRNSPIKDDRFCIFVRNNRHYRPQEHISFLPDGKWESRVWIKAGDEARQVLITRISDDIEAMVAYYSKVYKDCNQWVSIEMPTLPSGIEILAELSLLGKKATTPYAKLNH
jgi:pyrimidine deaminase RibD-like protein